MNRSRYATSQFLCQTIRARQNRRKALLLER